MLIIQDQRLVAGVEVHGSEDVVVNPAGHHEGERPIDLVCQVLVLHTGSGVLDEIGVPAVHAAEVSESASNEGPCEVQSGRRGMVNL